MLTNDVSSDIEKIIKTQPVEHPPGDNYVGRGDLPGKLSAFEKLIRHAISRFSMDRVYDLLRIVTTELRTQAAVQEKEEAAAAAATKAESTATAESENTEKGEASDKDSGTGADEDARSSPGKDLDNKSVKSDNSSKSSDRASGKSEKSTDSSDEKTEPVVTKKELINKTVSITSLKQVRDIIKGLELKEAAGEKLTDRQIVALRHYATFAKDVAYLRESKTYFYDNIYWSLLEDFFDPNEPTESRSSQSPTDNEKNNASPDSSATTGGRKNRKVKNSNRLPKNTIKKPEAPKDNDKKRIHDVVNELEEAMVKWTGLLEDDDQKTDYFDQDSHHEVVHYLHCAPFELVFRVVPDVFIKCYRALDLAREWIKIAERIYKGRLPLRRKVPRVQNEEPVEPVQEEQNAEVQETEEEQRQSKEAAAESYKKHMKKIKTRIVNVTERIKSHENQMTELTNEMKTLKTREDRVDKLNANFEKADSKLQTAQKEFSKYLHERQKTIDEIGEIPPGSLQHSELSKRAETLDKELTKRQIELGLLEYQKSVVQEDFLLELELRPNFIHFVGDVQGKMTDIKTDVQEKKHEKKKLERQLELMVTNTDRVKAVMSEYLGREPNDMDMEIAVRLASAEEDGVGDDDQESEETRQTAAHESETDYWQKEPGNYDSDGSVGLDSDQSFVSVSDDVDLTEFLPSTVVFGEVPSDRKMVGKTGGSKTSSKKKTHISQSSQQFSDAMRVLSPNSNPTSQRGLTGPKKLKPHSKIYKQMHATSYRPS